MRIREFAVYKRYLYISGFLRRSEKYWSIKKGSWVEYFKIDPLYFYRITLFNKRTRYTIDIKSLPVFNPKSYPVIYTPEELKERYPNRWIVPPSPDFLVKHEGRYYKITELKQFYN